MHGLAWHSLKPDIKEAN